MPGPITAPARRAPLERLPEFPWDSLTSYRELAAAHPEGVDRPIGGYSGR